MWRLSLPFLSYSCLFAVCCGLLGRLTGLLLDFRSGSVPATYDDRRRRRTITTWSLYNHQDFVLKSFWNFYFECPRRKYWLFFDKFQNIWIESTQLQYKKMIACTSRKPKDRLTLQTCNRDIKWHRNYDIILKPTQILFITLWWISP